MNNIVLTESKVRELEQFGRYLENLTLEDDGNELRPVLKSLDSVYKEMINRHFPEYRDRVEAYKMLDFVDACSGFGEVVYDMFNDIEDIYAEQEKV